MGNNLNTNRGYNKTKLVKKNKKVKFSIPINIKSNKSSSINKSIKNNNISINTNNYNNIKRNIIHRHTKSSFIQGTNIFLNKLIKDLSMTNINNNLNLNNNELSYINNKNSQKKIFLNNYVNDNTKMSVNNSNKKRNNKIVNQLNKNKIKNSQSSQMQKSETLRNDLIKSYREPINIKNGLVNIIEELKSENKKSENGLTKKFIEAQNNWRKNYFATVIQKIYRGFIFRKNYKNMSQNKISIISTTTNSKNKNININSSIYVKKKAKDNNNIYTSVVHRKECPIDEKNKLINKNKVPHKIKEIIISIKSKNEYLNNNLYFNNNIYSNFNNNVNNSYVKYAFDLWKEYSHKIGILKKLKIYKKYKKNVFRKGSCEKRKNNHNYKI